MKILVANLGSTSFKYRLFDMTNERQLARGGIERIGSTRAVGFVEIGDYRDEQTREIEDHAAAVRLCLEQLTDSDHGCLRSADEVSAIGFKAVHGGRVSGVQRVNPDTLDAMSEMNSVAPAHNPPYIAAMRILSERLPNIPLIAAFETGFHQTIAAAQKLYCVPYAWSEDYHVQKWGFHGASHRYISERLAEIERPGSGGRTISCHLGGSSSLCAIRDGKSVGTSMGMSPQTGLPHNNRCGDFDPFALPVLLQATGKNLDELLNELATESGLLGLSGLSGDVRDLEIAAADGHARAKLALDVFVAEIRRNLGGLMITLGGLDTLVFTGGIGENGRNIRSAVCEGLEEFGIELDHEANSAAHGESEIHRAGSRVKIRVLPTNEELIVARQSKQFLEAY